MTRLQWYGFLKLIFIRSKKKDENKLQHGQSAVTGKPASLETFS
jgi:hypothetical protein